MEYSKRTISFIIIYFCLLGKWKNQDTAIVAVAVVVVAVAVAVVVLCKEVEEVVANLLKRGKN